MAKFMLVKIGLMAEITDADTLRDGVPGAKVVYTLSSVDELQGTARRDARDAWSKREGITSWADLPESAD
jgi:hypothetical protein